MMRPKLLSASFPRVPLLTANISTNHSDGIARFVRVSRTEAEEVKGRVGQKFWSVVRKSTWMSNVVAQT